MYHTGWWQLTRAPQGSGCWLADGSWAAPAAAVAATAIPLPVHCLFFLLSCLIFWYRFQLICTFLSQFAIELKSVVHMQIFVFRKTTSNSFYPRHIWTGTKKKPPKEGNSPGTIPGSRIPQTGGREFLVPRNFWRTGFQKIREPEKGMHSLAAGGRRIQGRSWLRSLCWHVWGAGAPSGIATLHRAGLRAARRSGGVRRRDGYQILFVDKNSKIY